MSLDLLQSATKRAVGFRQVSKALEVGIVQRVYVANDAERELVAPLIEICQRKGLECCHVETRRLLGEACGIEVGASVAAVLAQ